MSPSLSLFLLDSAIIGAITAGIVMVATVIARKEVRALQQDKSAEPVDMSTTTVRHAS